MSGKESGRGAVYHTRKDCQEKSDESSTEEGELSSGIRGSYPKRRRLTRREKCCIFGSTSMHKRSIGEHMTTFITLPVLKNHTSLGGSFYFYTTNAHVLASEVVCIEDAHEKGCCVILSSGERFATKLSSSEVLALLSKDSPSLPRPFSDYAEELRRFRLSQEELKSQLAGIREGDLASDEKGDTWVCLNRTKRLFACLKKSREYQSAVVFTFGSAGQTDRESRPWLTKVHPAAPETHELAYHMKCLLPSVFTDRDGKQWRQESLVFEGVFLFSQEDDKATKKMFLLSGHAITASEGRFVDLLYKNNDAFLKKGDLP